jgi:hypothetical protein
MRQVNLPRDVIALASLFVFGALMSGTTALALLLPGSALAWIWRLNPRAHEAFGAMGSLSIALMSVVCLACALCARGLIAYLLTRKVRSAFRNH